MRTLAVVLTAALLGGCVGGGTLGEKGYVWCNNRFLEPGGKPWHANTGKAAVKGYMYGLAAALTLQAENSEGSAHYFKRPARLIPLDTPPPSASGFEVHTYLLKPLKHEDREEIIIAFTGSNSFDDWFGTNLSLFANMDQYNEARAYTLKMLEDPRVRGRKVVVTGISLGGGLAVHVVKSPLTGPFIEQAWVFNPSPKTFANDSRNDKIWLVASDGEFLTTPRKPFFRHLVSGWGKINSPPDQTVQNFNLIDANAIYAHYRWGIARQMLWAADYVESDQAQRNEWTEPLAIIADSHFNSCRAPWDKPRYAQPDPKTKPDYSGYGPTTAGPE